MAPGRPAPWGRCRRFRRATIDVRLFEALVRNALGVPHNYFASGAARMGDVVVVETTGELCMDTDFSQIDRFRHRRPGTWSA